MYILIWMGYLALVAPLCLAIRLAEGTLEDNLRWSNILDLDNNKKGEISLARNSET